MPNYRIEYLADLPGDIEERIHQGHISDEAACGIVCNYKTFSLLIKNSDDEVIAVLTAYTAFAEIYVEDIWVDPNYRRVGIARKLLESLEDRFKDKGYNNINLVTSHFQAPDFYKKCGFEIEFVRENKYNPKLTKYFFIKYFKCEFQNQGVMQ